MASLRDRRHAVCFQCFVLLCLSCTVAISQTVGDVSSTNEDTGSSDNTSAAPSTTTPATTIPATTAPTPTATSSTQTQTPSTRTSTPSTSSPTATATQTPTPTSTTKAPASASPTSTTSAPAATDPSTSSTSPASTIAAPVVTHYNSSTLPPGLSSSVLNGSDLVTVEVTETALGNGTTSYSYVIVTDAGSTEKVVVLSPETSSPATISSNGEDKGSTSVQSGSSSSESSNDLKTSSSLGLWAIIGIILGAFIFILVLFFIFFVQRRRSKQRSNRASSDANFDLPVIGKQVWLLDQNHSQADTEYADATKTIVDSRSSFSGSRRHRTTMWEHPVILASRIPIDHIELGDIISRGAFGVVLRGRYRDQDVAIKTLLPEKRKDMAHIQAFLSEVKLMATMEHPNIVQFIGVAWESLSDLYCVTEFMTGGDLRTLLKGYLDNDVQQGMDATKMQIAYDVAYALTYLHSLQPVVLHRDLKSRNILLTECLNAKLTDFGTSRVRSDGSMTSNVGSSLWMAPEVMLGRRYNEKADVFSLGVVISELDTHELPYSHAKVSNNKNGRPLPDTAVLQMVSMGKLHVRFSPFMHEDMGHFIERCVNVNPHERPTAAEVLYFLQMAIRK